MRPNWLWLVFLIYLSTPDQGVYGYCGDSIKEIGEQCDDGANLDNYDGCNSTCYNSTCPTAGLGLEGACCKPDNSCVVCDCIICRLAGSFWRGPDTMCTPGLCAATSAASSASSAPPSAQPTSSSSSIQISSSSAPSLDPAPLPSPLPAPNPSPEPLPLPLPSPAPLPLPSPVPAPKPLPLPLPNPVPAPIPAPEASPPPPPSTSPSPLLPSPDDCKDFGKCCLPHEYWSKNGEVFYEVVPVTYDNYICKSGKKLDPIYWMNHKPDTNWIKLASCYYVAVANFNSENTNRCCKDDKKCLEGEYFQPEEINECFHFARTALKTPFEKGDPTTPTKTDAPNWWTSWTTPTTLDTGTDKTPTTPTDTLEEPIPKCTMLPVIDTKEVDSKTLDQCTKLLEEFNAGLTEQTPTCKYGEFESFPTLAENFNTAKQSGFVVAVISMVVLVAIMLLIIK